MYRFLAHHRHDSSSTRKLLGTGELVASRERIASAKPNLQFLLLGRLAWVTDLHEPDRRGVEFGAGAGATKLLFPDAGILLSDIIENAWLDLPGLDAQRSELPAESLDYILVNNVLHHLPHPTKFLSEAHRILKPGGRLYIQEYHTSILGRLVLKLTNHESFDSRTSALTALAPLSSESDPWDANCDIARQLFDSQAMFEKHFPGFKIGLNRVTETLVFLNSGGVVIKAPHIPLGKIGLRLAERLDRALNSLVPNLFGLQRQILLIKQ